MIRIDGTEIKAFADQLRDFPRELRPRLRREIKKASSDLVRQVQQNAAWSTRIPKATKTRVGFGRRTSGVTVFVDRRIAPHARPLEFGNRGPFNRHPVFGGDTWVNQPTRPFFLRAVNTVGLRVVPAIQAAINEAFKRL